jgi:hypothetical protein
LHPGSDVCWGSRAGQFVADFDGNVNLLEETTQNVDRIDKDQIVERGCVCNN